MEPDMMDTETPNYFSFLGQKAPEKKKRKRGGLAGLWDRNKGAIGSIAGAALGNMLVPGAGAAVGKLLGGAAGGALARGRFDAGRAVGDAFMGSGAVNAAGAAKRGIGKLLGRESADVLRATPNKFGQPTLSTATQTGDVKETATGNIVGGPRYERIMGRPGYSGVSDSATTLRDASGAVSAATGSTMQPPARGLNRVLQFVEKNPQATGLSLQALSGILGSQEQRRIEEARLKEERRKAENLARLAMPMYLEGMRGMR